MTTYPVPVAEMRERYLKLYSGAVNDILRFDYRMHAALPSEFAPLDRSMKLAGQAFTIKGAPDITTDGDLKKRWKIVDGKRCLIKGGSNPFRQQPFNEVEKRFKAMGFDRVFGPGTAPETTIAALYEDFGIEKPEAEEG